jgi:alpha-aminoadipic semialdehyde synthase
VGVTWSDGRKERREITMTVRGDPASHTAMATTVGLPTAIAAKMVLDGKGNESQRFNLNVIKLFKSNPWY